MFTAVLSGDAQKALVILGQSGVVRDGYLAGGSALALHYGHRRSEDLDFFSPKVFDPLVMSEKLRAIGKFTPSFAEGISLIGKFCGVKFSYFQHNYPLLFPTKEQFGVTIVQPRDIGPMKVAAVMDRGTKRDFIDLYELVHQGVSTQEILDLYNKKYGALENNIISILRSLQYFDDAEKEDMPEMLRSVSWDEVKRFFAAEAVRLAKKYLEGEAPPV